VDHFGGPAVGLGAFRAGLAVVNDGAVTVLDPSHTGKASAAHVSQFLARVDACAPTARRVGGLTPTEFVQTVVVDAEVVRDLVDHRDRHLVDDLRLGVAELQQRLAVDRDGVR